MVHRSIILDWCALVIELGMKIWRGSVIGLMVVVFTCYHVSAQQEAEKDTSKRPIDFIFSVGGGLTHYLGDVQDASDKVTANVFGNRAAADLNLGLGLSRSFVLNLNVIYGKLSGNENTYRQHRNFETQMVLAGFNAEYNFAGLYKDRLPVVNPFITAGAYYSNYFNISTDKYYDGDKPYYYWSDRTIRDLPQVPGNEDIAKNVGRDYTYETSLVKNPVSSFTTSAGLGLDLHLSRAISLRLMSRYFFAVTDKVDGYYQGNAKGLTDGYLLNQLSLVINTAPFGKRRNEYQPHYKYLFDASQLPVVENEDQDGDGVKDMADRCAATPSGVKVDEEGCPLDSDVDGIPDYRDKQKNSAPGAIVDRDGVEVDYSMIAQQWNDTSGVFRMEWNPGYITGESPLGDGYTVNIKTVKKGSERLLSPKVGEIQELRRKVINDSLILYTLGVYEHFDEAELQSRQLNAMGENQAYGVAEFRAKQVAEALQNLDDMETTNIRNRSYALRSNLEKVKTSEAYKHAELAYSVARIEKHLDENVPEYLLVKEFLNSTAAYTWDPIVEKSHAEVQANVEKMPVPEKPQYVPIDEESDAEAVSEAEERSVVEKIDSRTAQAKVDETNNPSNRPEPVQQGKKDFKVVPTERPEVTVAPVKPAFAKADLDGNGFISSTEIERILEDILEGRSEVTVAQFNEMVQYYTYYTGNADPIDFSGTEVVIVDGVLTILKKEGEGFKDESRRILAKKYQEVDFNSDGDLTPDEVQKMINLFMEGKSSYSAERIYELIDLFFE